MTSVVIQGGALLLFLLLSLRWPRVGAPVLSRDTALNLVTGGALFGAKLLVLLAIGTLPTPRLIPMPFATHPVVQFAIVFLAGDLARYLVHRAHHEVGFLWQFHRVHHSSAHLNATSGLRMHAVDFLQLALIPGLLYGVLLDTSSFDPRVWVALAAVIAFMDAFQHADLRFPIDHPIGRAWYRVFNNPHFHSWHHVKAWDKYHGNYGQTLVIWDRLFRTAVDQPVPASDLGLSPDQAIELTPLGMQMLRRPPPVTTPVAAVVNAPMTPQAPAQPARIEAS